MPGSLQVGRDASLVVVAPHCDDETLAAAGLMAVAAGEGIPVRIVMMTNGDGFNRYALGSQHRRLRPTPAQYIQFAYLRQGETLRAAAQVGLSERDVYFLGYPDRGLAAMWGDHWEPARPFRSPSTRMDHSPYHNSFTPGAPFSGRALVDDLKRIFREVRPTHIITSHPHDAHSDHWAAYCFSLYALEELVQEGEAFAASTQVLAYLTHRGRWPRPGGYRPSLPLHPPRQYQALPFPWVAMDLPADVVALKHQALLAHQSQLRYMRNYLMSFVRRNELFGVFTPVPVPYWGRARKGRGPWGSPFGEGGWADEPGGWPGQPEVPFCEMVDAVPPSWVGRVRRSGDVRSVQAAQDGAYLYLRLNLRSRPAKELRYLVTLYGVPRILVPGSPGRNRLEIEVRVPGRVAVRAEGEWQDRPGEVVCQVYDRHLELAVPLAMVQYPPRVFIGIQTRYRRFVLDQVAWQVLALHDAASGRLWIPGGGALPAAGMPGGEGLEAEVV